MTVEVDVRDGYWREDRRSGVWIHRYQWQGSGKTVHMLKQALPTDMSP